MISKYRLAKHRHHVNTAIWTNHPREETIFTQRLFSCVCPLSHCLQHRAASQRPALRTSARHGVTLNLQRRVRVWVGKRVNKWMTKPLAACELKEKSRDRGDDGEMQQAGGGDNVWGEKVGGGGEGRSQDGELPIALTSTAIWSCFPWKEGRRIAGTEIYPGLTPTIKIKSLGRIKVSLTNESSRAGRPRLSAGYEEDRTAAKGKWISRDTDASVYETGGCGEGVNRYLSSGPMATLLNTGPARLLGDGYKGPYILQKGDSS